MNVLSMLFNSIIKVLDYELNIFGYQLSLMSVLVYLLLCSIVLYIISGISR